MDLAEQLRDADRRLIRAVDGLTNAAWTEPSLLPGWTRAHVVAHLTLNAEALTAALDGVAQGDRVPMYPSQERRDADIASLGNSISTGDDTAPGELRDRFLASTTEMAEALERLAVAGPEAPQTMIERTPGSGRSFAAGDVVDMRLREVEIHLCDLGVGATYAAWSLDFARLLLDGAAATRPRSTVALIRPTDLDGTWRFGGSAVSGPVVSGPATALAWWLTGRGAGEQITSESGTLPETGAW